MKLGFFEGTLLGPLLPVPAARLPDPPLAGFTLRVFPPLLLVGFDGDLDPLLPEVFLATFLSLRDKNSLEHSKADSDSKGSLGWASSFLRYVTWV